MEFLDKALKVLSPSWKTKHSLVLSPYATADDPREVCDLVASGDTATFVAQPSMKGTIVGIVTPVNSAGFPIVRIAKIGKVLFSGLAPVSDLRGLLSPDSPIVIDENERVYVTIKNGTTGNGSQVPVHRLLPTLVMQCDGGPRLLPFSPVKERPGSEETFSVPSKTGVSFSGSSDKKFQPMKIVIEADDYDGLFVTFIRIGKNVQTIGPGDVPAAAFKPENEALFNIDIAPAGMSIDIGLVNIIANTKKVKVSIEGMAEG